MTIQEIQSELRSIDAQIDPLVRRKNQLLNNLRTLRSLAWIEANGVRLKDVQLSSGDGIPWHGTIDAFREWLASRIKKKRFCEWNGRLFVTSDVVAGSFDMNGPGQLCDLKQKERGA